MVDGKGSAVISDIIANEQLPAGPPKSIDLIFFTSFQIFRTPNVRNHMEAMRNVMIQKWGADIRAQGDDKPLGQYSADDSKYASMQTLLSSPQMADYLFNKIAFLAKAPEGCRFIISDHPVVRYNERKYPNMGNLGLAQTGIEIYFPISSKLCLYFLCKNHADMLLTTPTGQLWNKLQRERLPISFDPENVTFVNSLQVMQSERWIYAKYPNDLDLPIEMLIEDPSLKLPASGKGFS